ncbi:MAG: AraC family transcriptional regulator [Alphaproteobacteria bacterium]|nr:MAG: AraC family transcriptional regulator [Alphaproteobacteria bacterium]
MNNILFTIPEVVSLIGVFQCVYLLVYVSFRAGNLVRVILPVLYFLILGTAFFIDLARGSIADITPYYDVISWTSWSLGTPLSVLLIIQMSHITKLPSLVNWSILLVTPLALAFSVFITRYVAPSCGGILTCPDFLAWLNVSGLVAGAISLLAIWGHRNIFSDVRSQKAGQERYWLILSLIIVNIFFLALTAFHTTGYDLSLNISLLRAILGLSFVYLISTSLFRIYPNALFASAKRQSNDALSVDDQRISQKIEDLLRLDKIYHEATYSRSDLARELNVAEATVSRIINVHFQKSFPQVLNERRVEDAKRLLLDTDASIKVIAEEVGFNSLPSFNRAFKDFCGQSPSDYRKHTIK